MNSPFLWTKYSFNSISDFHFGTEELKLCHLLVIIFHSVSNPDEAYSLSENLENIVVVIKTWINFDGVFCSNDNLKVYILQANRHDHGLGDLMGSLLMLEPKSI